MGLGLEWFTVGSSSANTERCLEDGLQYWREVQKTKIVTAQAIV